jgi:hypothetical protein
MDATAILAIAPTPAIARTLSRSKIESALRRGGRKRNIESRAATIQDALREEQLSQPPILENAYGITTRATIAVNVSMNDVIAELEVALSEHFEQHPDAKIIHSLPGMGMKLGARVLGEFGDDPNRYRDAKSRKNYAGTSPVTKTSGRSRVVHARHSRNKRLADALDQWAFCSTNWSPVANAYCDELKSRGKHHRKATRQLANKWVGILHAGLEHGTLYDEEIAWPAAKEIAA